MYDINKFESNDVNWLGDCLPFHKFNNMSTDGTSARATMKRPKRIPFVPAPRVFNNPIRPQADFIFGCDPGVRCTIAGVLRNIQDGASEDLKENEKRYKLSCFEWRDLTGENDRKVKLKHWTDELEGRIRAEREELDNIGQSHPNFELFTRFELSFFMEKCGVYMTDKIAGLKFNRYCRTKSAAIKVAKDICPEGKKTIVAFGDFQIASDSYIKG